MSDFEMLENVRIRLTKMSFKGRTLLDGKETGVLIEYISPDEMRVAGLKPDLPPYIYLKPGIINSSNDGKKWDKLELGTGLQILYILDPRMLLTKDAYKIVDSQKTNTRLDSTIEYNLETLRNTKKLYIPDEFLQWMIEHGERKRAVRLSIAPDGTMTKMVQKELPPSTQELSVLFEY